MIRVYFLPCGIVYGTEHIAGEEFIHDALLDTTADSGIRRLIQDTTPTEHTGLIAAGGVAQDATQQDIDRYHALVIITPPNPDIVRAKELLATSPPVITIPEMWELMHIYGRLLGIPE